MALACALGKLLALSVLGVAAVLDWRYREIPPELWVPGLLVAPPLGVGCALAIYPPGAALVLSLLSLALAGLVLALYLTGLIGGADAFAAGLIALAMPVPERPGLPPLVAALLYASLLSIAYRLHATRRATGRARVGTVEVGSERLLSDPRLRWWVPRGVDVEEEWWHELPGAGVVEAAPGAPLVSFMLVGLLLYLVVGDPVALLLEWRM